MTDLITVEGGPERFFRVRRHAAWPVADGRARRGRRFPPEHRHPGPEHRRAAAGAAGGPARTASVHVAYPRPVPVGARVRFAAQVVHLGRAFGVVRVTAHNHDTSKALAIATVTVSPA